MIAVEIQELPEECRFGGETLHVDLIHSWSSM